MNEVVAAEALQHAEQVLDTENRLWILGLSHITRSSWHQAPFHDEVEQIFDLCHSAMDFPAGPVAFRPGGWQKVEFADFRGVVLCPPDAPHLQMRIGLGREGVVGVALTRGGQLDGLNEPRAVLLTDIESVMADLYSVTLTVALTAGQICPIDMTFLIPEAGPGQAPIYYAPDPDTGELVLLRRDKKPFKRIHHRYEITSRTSPEHVDDDLVALATRMARQIGAKSPQLVLNRRPVATIPES